MLVLNPNTKNGFTVASYHPIKCDIYPPASATYYRVRDVPITYEHGLVPKEPVEIKRVGTGTLELAEETFGPS